MKKLCITFSLSLLLSVIAANNSCAEQETNRSRYNESDQLKITAKMQPTEELTKDKKKSDQKQNSYKAGEGSVFGYDFFENAELDNLKGVSTGILPDYILKPHDEISINIWGDLNLHYILALDNDMNVIIPEAGRVSLGGLTYTEAKTKILNQLSKTYAFYIDATNPGAGKAPVDISLSKTSGIRVFITGAILNPRDISCESQDSSIFSVIKKAGGITEQGSLRNIKLRKVNGKEINFDLYDFLINGKLSNELKYLSDGDIVYVPMISRQVTIMGSVKRPGVFELVANDKLTDLINLAGGLIPDAIPDLKITRIIKGNTTGKVLDINLNNQGKFELCDGDVVRVVVNPNNSITGRDHISITGAIRFPGQYRYADGETITKFLQRAGGLHKSAFPSGAKLIRNSSPYVIDLDKAIEFPGSEADFVLFPNDRISIPMFSNFVTVQGAVRNPIIIPYQKDKDANYYIENAGGYKDNASKGSVEIIIPNGSVINAFPGSWFTSNPKVPTGSTVNVQGK